MAATIFAVIAAALPVSLFCTAPVLLVARLGRRPWSWGRAAFVAAALSALVAVGAFGAVAYAFAGGLRLVDGLAAAAAGAVEASLFTALVAAGGRILDKRAVEKA